MPRELSGVVRNELPDPLAGFGVLAIGGFLLALIETVSAKMRIFRAPEFLGTAFMLAVLALLLHALLET